MGQMIRGFCIRCIHVEALVSNEVPGKCILGKGTGEMERKWSMEEHQPVGKKKQDIVIIIIIIIIIPHAIDLIQLYYAGYY